MHKTLLFPSNASDSSIWSFFVDVTTEKELVVSPKHVHIKATIGRKGIMQSAIEGGRREAERRRERLPTLETVPVTAEEAEKDTLAHEALEAG
ncbi:hypothetical protein L1987_09234 [Smallanthus sonchifolius]|uniref:Uncharacterized protein n=1 Tax=Smallanthus sonchifolius TaxID=185202 RepID=A0ACB9JP95_9ASTR|nr:hypothetical protein L1987_09234 [Smallanthus sonchifolius]